MKLNITKPLVVFDLETTGLDIVKDRVIQISYIKVMPDGREERNNIFVNPQRVIPDEVVALTGITNELVKDDKTFRMERRSLAAAYQFYCGRKMEDDFPPHRADNDTEATYRVLMAQLDKYNPETADDPEKVLHNDMDELAALSKSNDNVDFAGRIVWKDMVDANGKPLLDGEGNPRKQEAFNFGKYKGWYVTDVLRKDPGYYSWMLSSDFTNNTKQVLTRIRMREFMNKKG